MPKRLITGGLLHKPYFLPGFMAGEHTKSWKRQETLSVYEEIPLRTVLDCTRLDSVGTSGPVSAVYHDQFLWFHQGMTSDTRFHPNQGGKAGKWFHLTALCRH